MYLIFIIYTRYFGWSIVTCSQIIGTEIVGAYSRKKDKSTSATPSRLETDFDYQLKSKFIDVKLSN